MYLLHGSFFIGKIMKYFLARKLLKRRRRKIQSNPLGFKIDKKGRAMKTKKLEYIPGR